MNLKKLWTTTLVFAILLTFTAAPVWACFAVVVGKKASADGAVLVGHNEQNRGARYLNFRRVPQMKYPAGTMIEFRGGAKIPQVAETYSYLWSQNPGMAFSDAYFNEFGVAVVSNGCPDRGDKEGLVNQGATNLLRRIVVERAKTAREGVKIAGEVVEEVGYGSSRIYVIADKDEAWLVGLTMGKHWAARRVPDDEVVLVPNIYVITEVNLEDKDNYMGSADLIDWAVKKGWYKPDAGTPFRFSDVYASPRRERLDPRQWRGQSMVTGVEIPEAPDRQLPFSVKPSRKMTIKDVATILRYHGGKGAICGPMTQEGAVFQLRSGMPTEIGCVYWRTTAEPCSSALVPWYCGITDTPADYYEPVSIETQLTNDYQFEKAPPMVKLNPKHAWLPFIKIQNYVAKNHDTNITAVRKFWDEFEEQLLSQQANMEALWLKQWQQDPSETKLEITLYSQKAALDAIKQAYELIKQLKIE